MNRDDFGITCSDAATVTENRSSMVHISAYSALSIHGILNVNKPEGWTSHDVVAKVRRLLGGKVGHAGTLDPAATGVLPLLLGRATRIAEYLLEWDKEYVAVLRLGRTTDTQDATGTVLSERPIDRLTDEHIRRTITRFKGSLMQLPPMYSAVKIGGRPLYKAAREGKILDRKPRAVTVSDIEVLNINGGDIVFRVVCSKGTYIRTLCSDIGEALEVGAHLLQLRRTRVGPLRLEDAYSLEEVHSIISGDGPVRGIISLDDALRNFPEMVVDEPTARRVGHGVPVPLDCVRWVSGTKVDVKTAGLLRLKDPVGRLLAIGKPSDRVVAILKVLIGAAEMPAC
jgi:tRNA pseudouridine55 synthase